MENKRAASYRARAQKVENEIKHWEAIIAGMRDKIGRLNAKAEACECEDIAEGSGDEEAAAMCGAGNPNNIPPCGTSRGVFRRPDVPEGNSAVPRTAVPPQAPAPIVAGHGIKADLAAEFTGTEPEKVNRII
jgi:hypothetical protein